MKPVGKRITASLHPRATSQDLGNRWSWVQFFCAFVLAGLVTFLHIDPPLDGISAHVIKTVIIAGLCGFLAGRFDDAAWHGILRLLRWS